jgi:hypothetical protein
MRQRLANALVLLISALIILISVLFALVQSGLI